MGLMYYTDKVKYLVIYIKSITNCVDPSGALKFLFGCFSNIMAVLGYGRDDMLAIHLIKTYCLLMLLYGCEIWCMTTYITANIMTSFIYVISRNIM